MDTHINICNSVVGQNVGNYLRVSYAWVPEQGGPGRGQSDKFLKNHAVFHAIQ